MIRFVLQRFVGMLVTMFVVSIIVFIIMQLPPGDYAERYAFRKYSGADGVVIKESDIENIRHKFGLDRPQWEQYAGLDLGHHHAFRFW